MLNEATGRLPPINNGPPVGPGGKRRRRFLYRTRRPAEPASWRPGAFIYGIADVQHALPNPAYDISGGLFSYGTGNDHMPSFDGFTYLVFGERHFLDMMQWQGNRHFISQQVGPGPDLGQGYYKDNNAKFTDGNVYHYWGLLLDCCQSRGSAWMIRDVTYPAAPWRRQYRAQLFQRPHHRDPQLLPAVAQFQERPRQHGLRHVDHVPRQCRVDVVPSDVHRQLRAERGVADDDIPPRTPRQPVGVEVPAVLRGRLRQQHGRSGHLLLHRLCIRPDGFQWGLPQLHGRRRRRHRPGHERGRRVGFRFLLQ